MKKYIFVLTIVLLISQVLCSEVEECYVCLEKCDIPLKKQKCTENGKISCFSIQITLDNMTWVEKGCLPANIADVECGKANQNFGTTCTVCDTNLCNDIHKEEEDMYVDECYACTDACDQIEVQNCKEVLGENTNSQCIAIEHMKDDGEVYIERGCTEVTQDVKNTCDVINQKGGNCTICDTNLCNGYHKEDDNGSSAEMVYSSITILICLIFLIQFID